MMLEAGKWQYKPAPIIASLLSTQLLPQYRTSGVSARSRDFH